MPELPEVETVRRQLHERLKGCVIQEVDVWKHGREFPAGSAFAHCLVGKRIASVDRRAKLLVWRFGDGTALTAHLKMTGRFTFVESGYTHAKHDRIRFVLEEPFGARVHLIWSDVRQFGFARFVKADELATILSEYGPEPLETSAEALADCLPKQSSRSIKAVLLDQGVIAGIGNIYADESCFRAAILPSRKASSLSEAERLALAEQIKNVLSESVKQRGTSANDYVDVNGEKGGFLELLKVYGREKEPCVTCKTPIEKMVQAQRGTHFCPNCQH